jgi:putative transposase
VHVRRELIDTILDVLRGGIAWRAMPDNLPPWQSVYHSFRLSRLDGTREHINAALRERVRRQAGCDLTPSAAIIDSQRVKTTETGGRAATMGARSWPDASGTSWSIPMACCCGSS